MQNILFYVLLHYKVGLKGITENIKTEAYKVRGRLKAMELSIEEEGDDEEEGSRNSRARDA